MRRPSALAAASANFSASFYAAENCKPVMFPVVDDADEISKLPMFPVPFDSVDEKEEEEDMFPVSFDEFEIWNPFKFPSFNVAASSLASSSASSTAFSFSYGPLLSNVSSPAS